MSYTVSKLNTWLTFDANARRFTGALNALQHVGNSSINVTASDGYVTTADQFSLQVVHNAPTLQNSIAAQLPNIGDSQIVLGRTFDWDR